MKKSLIYAISIVAVLTGGFLFLKNSLIPNDESEYLRTVKYKVDSTHKPYNSNSISVPNYDQQSLTEIVINGEDLKVADKENMIGSSNPYNQSYVTESDIIDSVNRILSKKELDIDTFSEDYRQYLINLRHIEMIEKVSETHSNILRVAEEYVGVTSNN